MTTAQQLDLERRLRATETHWNEQSGAPDCNVVQLEARRRIIAAHNAARRAARLASWGVR